MIKFDSSLIELYAVLDDEELNPNSIGSYLNIESLLKKPQYPAKRVLPFAGVILERAIFNFKSLVTCV